MTDSTIYDGSGKLSLAIAELCKVSSKNSIALTKLTQQAKDALGITTKLKRLPDNVKLDIYRWHYDRLQAVELFSHDTIQPVEIISQAESVEAVEIFSQVRIAFYTVNKGVRVRQVIALDGFYVNALMVVTGIDKKDAPKWVQQSIDNWEAFDSALPITRQVKFLIIRELTAQIERLKMPDTTEG